MPKRRDVTLEELASIINLRERNASWLKIEHITGVPRQIAKRAYMDQQLKLSREELKAARQTVAAEEFRKHMDYLIKLAQSLVSGLDVPSFSDKRNADDVLLHLWQSDILGEYGSRPAYRPPTEREIDRTRCRNEMLLESLQNHTHEKVDWKNLSKWKDAWNACREYRLELRDEGKGILENSLKEKPELREGIFKGSEGKHIKERIVDGIVNTIWQGILIGELDEVIDELDKFEKLDEDYKVDQILDSLYQEIASSIQAVSGSDGITEILFGKTKPMSVPIFAQADRAKELVEISLFICNTLCRGKNVKLLLKKFRIMKEVTKYLEENLDEIILRPMILNSPKCKLCPA